MLSMSNYIVFDLEWNQASRKEYENKRLRFEILQIGAVKLSPEGKFMGSYTSYVRPSVYKRIHDMTQKVVHFNIKQLMKERGFKRVAEEFLKWCGEDYYFCSWGTSDLSVLQSNLAYYDMPPLSKGPLKYYDAQKIFSLHFEDGKSRKSLGAASEMLNIKGNSNFHSAMADADYTAKIFVRFIGSEAIKYHSFDNYYLPEDKESEIKEKFPTYNKYISRAYEDKNAAMRNREVSSVRCPKCGKNCKRLIKWFTANSGKYFLCLASCKDHGFVKSKARIKKNERAFNIYVMKTTKLIDDTIAEEIRDRYKKAKEKDKNKEAKSEEKLS